MLSTLSLLPLLTGCIVLDVERGSGVIVEEARDVSPFGAVVSASMVDVEVVVSEDEPSIVVVTDDNVVDLIRTRFEGDSLVIDVVPGVIVHPTEAVVRVTAPALAALHLTGSGDGWASGPAEDTFELRLTGSGDAVVEGVAAQEVLVSLTGSGNAEIVGETGLTDATVTGSGSLAAGGLLGHEARALLTGSGDAELFADCAAQGTTTGSGNLVILGGAETCQLTSTGSGEAWCE